MKGYNQVEVILFSRYYFHDFEQKELIKWLGTTMQPLIAQQNRRAKKLFLERLKHTPPIYLS